MKFISTALASILLFAASNTFSQLVAFPGAEGAGKFTTGGRGTATQHTAVFIVTSLSDVNTPGTLRYACQASQSTYPYRTIIFRVAGTIHLNSKLNIYGNTTIVGQTAPGDGICIADWPVVISGDNVIMRYIRCRMGDKNQNKGKVDGSGGDDALGNLGNKNIIIDHCSVSWSDDECLTVYRGDSVTLQWNFITEPLNYSYHFETGDADYEQHGYGGIQGGRHATMHHNLYAHCKNRMPRFAGSSSYTPKVQGSDMAELSNNVIYNWGINNVYGGEGGYYNMVNNYLKTGPSTTSRKTQVVSVDSGSGLPYAKYYLTGNFITTSTANSNNNWLSVTMTSGKLSDTQYSKVTTPFNLPAITMQTPQDAYNSVLMYGGCSLPNRDTLDQRIANDVKNGTGRLIDVQGGYPHGTAYDQTVNAWPTLNSGPVPVDTDADGMPDTWETNHGLNPTNANDRYAIAPSGYTWLEEYLNDIIVQAAMPLKLVSLNGSYEQRQVKLTWNTTNEINTDRFIIERSSDGSNYGAVGTVRALNIGAANNIYSFTDPQPLTGKSYYRLRMVDKDGAYTYSAVLSFNSSAKGILTINPNPVVKNITISHAKALSAAYFQIFSVDGKLQLSYKAAAGSEQTSLDASALARGIYTLVYINDNERTSERFLKQ